MDSQHKVLFNKFTDLFHSANIPFNNGLLTNYESDSEYRHCRIYRLPFNEQSLRILERLCTPVSENRQYLLYQTSIPIQIPCHAISILEASFYSGDPLKTIDHIYFQIPTGNKYDFTCSGTLYDMLITGQRYSERHILKWAIQILSSLIMSHKHFIIIGYFDCKDICIMSDPFVKTHIKSFNKARENYIINLQRLMTAANPDIINGSSTAASASPSPSPSPRAGRKPSAFAKKLGHTNSLRMIAIQNDVLAQGGGLQVDVSASGTCPSPPPTPLSNNNNPIRLAATPTPSNVSSPTKTMDRSGAAVQETQVRKDAWLFIPVHGLQEVAHEDYFCVAEDGGGGQAGQSNVGSPTSTERSFKRSASGTVSYQRSMSRIRSLQRAESIPYPNSTAATASPPPSPPRHRKTSPSHLQRCATPSAGTYLSLKNPHASDKVPVPPPPAPPASSHVSLEAKAPVESDRYSRFNDEIPTLDHLLHIDRTPALHRAPMSYSTLKNYSIPAEKKLGKAKVSAFELTRCQINVAVVESATSCRRLLQSFIKAVYHDLRCLGVILVQCYLRSTLNTTQLTVMLQPKFTHEDLLQQYDLSRFSKGLQNLISFCFCPCPADVLTESPDDLLPDIRTIKLPVINKEETYLRILRQEYRILGTVDRDDLPHEEEAVVWTDRDERKFREKEAMRHAELENKALIGRDISRARVMAHKKQIWFDMLPEEMQRKIIHKRKARKLSRKHSVERMRLIHYAGFHRWRRSELRRWIVEGITAVVKKFYYLKKSGVRMSLDDKHNYARTAGVVEYCSRQLNNVIESAKLSGSTESLSADAGKKDKKDKRAVAAVMKANVTDEEEQVSRPGTAGSDSYESRPSSQGNSRPGTSSTDNGRPLPSSFASQPKSAVDVPTADIGKKSLPVSHVEEERRYLEGLSFFSKSYATLILSYLEGTPGLFLYHKINMALMETNDILENSAIARLLPAEQFREKMLLTATKIMCKWEIFAGCATQLSNIINLKETTWKSDTIVCVCYGMILKFTEEEDLRHKGSALAASRISALARGVSVRSKIRKIWEEADGEVKKMEEHNAKMERERAANVSWLSKKLGRSTSNAGDRDEGGAEGRQDAEERETTSWASVQVSRTTNIGCDLLVSLKIPQDTRKFPSAKTIARNVKCLGRILKQPERIPEGDTSLRALTPNSEQDVCAYRGEVEVLLEDVQRLMARNEGGAWVRGMDGKGSECLATCHWETPTSQASECVCKIMVHGLIPYRCYRVRVLANAVFKPSTDDSSHVDSKQSKVKPLDVGMNTVRIGGAVVTTLPTVPLAPHMAHADLLHYDSKELPSVMTKATPPDSLGTNLKLQFSEEIEKPMSIVDKLQAYNASKGGKQNHKNAATTTVDSPACSLLSKDLLHIHDKLACVDTAVLHRIVACRLTWTIPYANGSPVTSYELQKRYVLYGLFFCLIICRVVMLAAAEPKQEEAASGVMVGETYSSPSKSVVQRANRWEIVNIVATPSCTDFLEISFSAPNPPVEYRVRACNGVGWGPFGGALPVQAEPSKVVPCLPSPLTRAADSSVKLPHQVSVTRSGGSPIRGGVVLAIPTGMTGLGKREDTAPPEAALRKDSLTRGGHQARFAFDEQGLDVLDSMMSRRLDVNHVSNLDSSSMSPDGHIPLKSVRHYHDESTLGGDSLTSVNHNIQKWLTRLADASPMEHNGVATTAESDSRTASGEGSGKGKSILGDSTSGGSNSVVSRLQAVSQASTTSGVASDRRSRKNQKESLIDGVSTPSHRSRMNLKLLVSSLPSL